MPCAPPAALASGSSRISADSRARRRATSSSPPAPISSITSSGCANSGRHQVAEPLHRSAHAVPASRRSIADAPQRAAADVAMAELAGGASDAPRARKPLARRQSAPQQRPQPQRQEHQRRRDPRRAQRQPRWRSGCPASPPARSPAACRAWCRPPPATAANTSPPAARSRPGSCRRSRRGRTRSVVATKRAARRQRAAIVVERVRLQRPQRDRDEADRHDPAQHRRASAIARPARRARPASAWLSRVATRMPATIGHGLRKRAASSKASSWVLSPISASATVPVEISAVSNGMVELGHIHLATPGPGESVDAKADATPPGRVRSACLRSCPAPSVRRPPRAPWPAGQVC